MIFFKKNCFPQSPHSYFHVGVMLFSKRRALYKARALFFFSVFLYPTPPLGQWFQALGGFCMPFSGLMFGPQVASSRCAWTFHAPQCHTALRAFKGSTRLGKVCPLCFSM
uniref:Uncharacterized protein n=1 Tax=Sphaerodactylus townsendi TaxID=933632 RepID=A0ACB8E6J6_9SAUR